MEDTVPDSPRLSFHQEELLEGIKYCKNEIQTELQRLPRRSLDNLNPEELARYYEGPEFSRFRRLREDLDRLTVKAIRSLLRRVPGKKGFTGLSLAFAENIRGGKEDNYQTVLIPGPGIEYHPKIPRWALDHICRWIMEKRFLPSNLDRDFLAKCKMGLETGLQEPKNLDLLKKVLSLRGFDINSEKVIDKIWKTNKRKESKRGRPRKRVRKNKHSWDHIALMLKDHRTGEGLKDHFKKIFPSYNWDKI